MLTLVKNANLYTPTPMGLTDILVAGEKIAALETDLTITGIPGMKVVDVKGMTVIPGIVDGHVHLIGGGGEGGFATRTPEADLSHLVKGGVTTVLGLLGVDCVTRHISSLYAKTKALNIEGITAYMITGGYPVPSPVATTGIREDIMLLDVVIGLKTAISDHRSSHPNLHELGRAASQVRTAALASGKAGCIVVHMGGGKAGFAPLFDLVDQTDIPIRQFIPTHVNRKEALFNDALNWTKQGGFIDLTAGINPERGAVGSVKVSTAIARSIREGYDMSRICVSSDANGSVPIFDDDGSLKGIGVAGFDPLLREFSDMINHESLTIEQAITPFTTAPSNALGLNDRKGSLCPGKDADFLFLNPDLSLEHVMAKGQTLMEEGQMKVWGTFEKH